MIYEVFNNIKNDESYHSIIFGDSVLEYYFEIESNEDAYNHLKKIDYGKYTICVKRFKYSGDFIRISLYDNTYSIVNYNYKETDRRVILMG